MPIPTLGLPRTRTNSHPSVILPAIQPSETVQTSFPLKKLSALTDRIAALDDLDRRAREARPEQHHTSGAPKGHRQTRSAPGLWFRPKPVEPEAASPTGAEETMGRAEEDEASG